MWPRPSFSVLGPRRSVLGPQAGGHGAVEKTLIFIGSFVEKMFEKISNGWLVFADYLINFIILLRRSLMKKM